MAESPSPEPGPADAVCSARGCLAPAVFDLQWNNPKIHTPDRRKHWVSCGDHCDSLSSFLATRGFLRSVVPLEPSA